MLNNEEIDQILDEIHFQPYIHEDISNYIKGTASNMCMDAVANYLVKNQISNVYFNDFTDIQQLNIGINYRNYNGFELKFDDTETGKLIYANDNVELFVLLLEYFENSNDFEFLMLIDDEEYKYISKYDVVDILNESDVSEHVKTEAIEAAYGAENNIVKPLVNDIDTICKQYWNVGNFNLESSEDYDIMRKIMGEDFNDFFDDNY